MAAHSKKMNIAIEQLEDGLALFFDKRYMSSLTLSGAATEIFGVLFEEIHGVHPIDIDWESTNRIRTALGNEHISKGRLKQLQNRAKNIVKHHDLGSPNKVYLDRFAEAFIMIQRGTNLANALKLSFKHKARFEKWLQINFGT